MDHEEGVEMKGEEGMRHQSPPRRADPQDSPEMRSRKSEKKQMSDLNSRLEVIMLKIREREERLRAIQSQSDEFIRIDLHDTIVAEVREENDEILKQIRESRDKFKIDAETAQSELDEALKNLAVMEENLEETNRAKAELQKLSGDLMSQLATKEGELTIVNSKLETTKAELDSLYAAHESLKSELSKNRKLVIENDGQLVIAQAKLKSLMEDYSIEKKHLEAEIERLTKLNKVLDADANEIEKRVRTEMTEELMQEVSRVEQEASKRKMEAIEKLYQEYQSKLLEFSNNENNLLEEIKNLQSSATSMQSLLAERDRVVSTLQAEIDHLLSQNSSLRSDVDVLTQKSKDLLAERLNEVTELKNRLAESELAYGRILGYGMAVANTVGAITENLTSEEERLNVHSKVDFTEMEDAKPLANTTKIQESPSVKKTSKKVDTFDDSSDSPIKTPTKKGDGDSSSTRKNKREKVDTPETKPRSSPSRKVSETPSSSKSSTKKRRRI